MAQKRTGHVSYDEGSARGRRTGWHADRYSICSFVTIGIAFRGKAPVKAEASLHRGSRAPVRPAAGARGAPRGTLENRVGGARGSLEPLSWRSLAPTMRLSLPRYLNANHLKRNGVHQWGSGGLASGSRGHRGAPCGTPCATSGCAIRDLASASAQPDDGVIRRALSRRSSDLRANARKRAPIFASLSLP